MDRGLSKKERLLRRSDFLRVQRGGTRYSSGHFIVLVTPGPGLNHHRLGITAGRSSGNAVRRNRVKRLVREFFRLNKRELFPSLAERGADIVVIVKRDCPQLCLDDVVRELMPCCRK